MKISEAVAQQPAVSRLIKFLDSQPTDEVFSSVELFQKTGIDTCSGSIQRAIHNKLQKYYQPGSVKLWGNPRALANLKASLEKP